VQVVLHQPTKLRTPSRVYRQVPDCGIVWRTFAAWLLSLALIYSTNANAQYAPPKSPEDPIAAKAYRVLEQACASCHQTGLLKGIANPAGDFGNVLDLAAVLANPARVVPGQPEASKLFTMMSARSMPPDAAPESGEIGIEQLDAVREWIIRTPAAQATCAQTNLKTGRDIATQAAAYFDTLDATKAKSVRLLDLSPLGNACISTNERDGYRQALATVINSLSWGFETAVLQPVDPDGHLLAVDLALLGWDLDQWESLSAISPYNAANPVSANLAAKSGSRTPILRGDWFAKAATRAPLYYELLGLPDRLAELVAGLKLEPASSPQTSARRLGIKSSSIARGNRLIERYGFANGAAWMSSEFAPTAGRPDLFEATATPLPDGAASDNPTGTVRPDATLMHFSLPNGFRAFFMSNADGQRINDAPHSILTDPAKPSLRVGVAQSCLSCHARDATAITPATIDDLLARLSNNAQLARDAKDRAIARHFKSENLAQAISDDNARLAKAQKEVGVEPKTLLSGLSPVPALLARYAQPLNWASFAAELGLTAATPELRAIEARASPATKSILTRLQVGLVSRADVERVLPEIYALFAGEAVPTTAATINPLQIVSPPTDSVEDIELVLESEKARYKPGDVLSVTARVNRTCNLTVLTIDPRGRATVIYPNDFEPTNTLEAGRLLRVPTAAAPYQLRLAEKGRETIVGICSSTQKWVDGMRHDFEKQRFTALGEYRAFLLRNWANGGDNGEAKIPRARGRGARTGEKNAERTQPRADQQGRTAIQIEVE
jgi:mono/diheme cytochrome c family protein/cytochrome c553